MVYTSQFQCELEIDLISTYLSPKSLIFVYLFSFNQVFSYLFVKKKKKNHIYSCWDLGNYIIRIKNDFTESTKIKERNYHIEHYLFSFEVGQRNHAMVVIT